MRRWTSAAPASRIMRTILREVVPRTIESSISTTRLPAMISRTGLSFTLTPKLRIDCLRLDEGAADVVVARHAELERQPRLAAVADRRDRDRCRAPARRCRRPPAPRAPAARPAGGGPRPPSRRRPRCRGARSRRARRAQRDGSRLAAPARNDSSRPLARHHHLARLELAQLSARPAGRRRTTPRRSSGSRSSSAIASGRKPCGSRAAIRQLSVMSSSE